MLVLSQVSFVGSTIGSPSQIKEMFAIAVEKNVRAMMHKGQARFRIVLENQTHDKSSQLTIKMTFFIVLNSGLL
ncbi:hypothetical protein THRCLA_23149 [Thraustotheca clavata]|uniref:Uncharacterized protein n=1 Tax=Thraustotheca clavata TaxID=74557 RepID=A0A1V9YCM2_9STRA|nr:hypothetical protein THRCLA_23149 [Thraustotheca clavata]